MNQGQIKKKAYQKPEINRIKLVTKLSTLGEGCYSVQGDAETPGLCNVAGCSESGPV